MSESYTFEFLAPDVLLNMNDRLHWAKRSRIARAWRDTSRHACVAGLRHAMPPCFVHITLPVPDGRRRDPHNYEITSKHIVDGLVDAYVWPDDTPEFVSVMPVKLEKRTVRYVTVELVPR